MGLEAQHAAVRAFVAARLAELLRAKGHTLQQIADELNQPGYRTRRGRTFHPTTVQRLLPVQHEQAG